MFSRPTDVWVKRSARYHIYGEGRNWDVEQNFNAGESHEAQEPIGADVAIAWEYGVELGIVYIEGLDSQDGVGSGKQPNDYRWQINDGIHGPSIIDGSDTAIIFENVETMTLNDVVCKFSVR